MNGHPHLVAVAYGLMFAAIFVAMWWLRFGGLG